MKTKKIKIKLSLLFVVVVFLSCIFISGANKTFAEIDTSAKSMVVVEAKSGRVLYGKNYNEKLPMASTTKIITALTVLNNYKNIDKEVQIDDRAVGISGTSIYLKYGEKLTVRELLYGLMLPSGNDASVALAYIVGGNMPNFCKLMKETAIKCGANNSNFANSHGLDEDGHYTTALDLAKITAKALENEIFKEIVTTKNTRIKGSTEGSYRYLKNKNKLLNILDGCIGVKTGYTSKAGRCLVSAVERNDFRAVCVVLNCGPMFEESLNLLNNVYNEYSYVELLPSYKINRSILVNDGKKNSVKTFTKMGFKYPLKKDEINQLEYKYNLPNNLDAPIKKDVVIGNLEIYLNNHLLFSEKIYTMDNIEKIGVWSSIKDIISKW